MNLELISFELCPFVQRSVITLKYKNVDFKLTNIDLKNKPEWFLKISPMGKVPVLKVNGTVLFESAIINEYIDETVGEPLMPKDPLQKALERGWIEFGSQLINALYMVTLERDRAKLEPMITKFFQDLAKVESILQNGPYFRGSDFSLVDAAWAPLFMRIYLSQRLKDHPLWSEMPKTRKWADELLKVPAVKNSVIENFAEEYSRYAQQIGSALFNS